MFFPQGLAGRLYWLVVLPFHGFIFAAMAARITAAAEQLDEEAVVPRGAGEASADDVDA